MTRLLELIASSDVFYRCSRDCQELGFSFERLLKAAFDLHLG
jgi:hypothetical protein